MGAKEVKNPAPLKTKECGKGGAEERTLRQLREGCATQEVSNGEGCATLPRGKRVVYLGVMSTGFRV